MSKGGLYAHFGSKEELQLATVEAARRSSARTWSSPPPRPPSGLDRLRRLVDGYLS